MGNATRKFDIISSLPQELVMIIISVLTIRDVANCSLVCWNWRKVIFNLRLYWLKQSLKIGLSTDAVMFNIDHFSSPGNFYFAAVKYKRGMKVNKLTFTQLDIQQLFMDPEKKSNTFCLHARRGNIVQVCKDVDGTRLELKRVVNTHQKNITTKTVYSLQIHSAMKVAWAHIHGDYLYWISRNGVWKGFDTLVGKELFTWNSPLLNDGIGTVVSCCKKCPMMVASHWVPTSTDTGIQWYNSICSLQVVKLGVRGSSKPKQILKWNILTSNHSHQVFIQHDSRYWLRETYIVSTSNTTVDGLCSTHSLILQSDSCVMIQSIEMSSKNDCLVLNKNSLDCVHCMFDMSCYRSNSSIQGRNSNVTLSSDEQLIGQVCGEKLHVWKHITSTNTHKGHISLQLSSEGKLPTNETHGACKSVRLIAIGHILSIIAYLRDTYVMDYKLQFVLTMTGEVLSEYQRTERFYDWTICCQIDPLHKFYFMTDEHDDWLNHVNSSMPGTPIVTLHNHNGKLHLEALQHDKISTQTWRTHWKSAINYGYRS